MSSFPRYPAPPRGNDRQAFQRFSDYGTSAAIDISSSHNGEIRVHPQKDHYNDGAARLVASEPSLPVMPPKLVANESDDVCMGKLHEERERLHQAVKLLRRHAGQVKVNRNIFMRTRQYLSTLEKLGDKSHREWLAPAPFPSMLSLAKELDGKIGKVSDVPIVNSAYVGGCIKCQEVSDSPHRGVVAYPTGNDMSTLALSEVSCQGSDDKLQWSHKPRLTPLKRRIFQLDMQRTRHGKTYCALRHAKMCHIVQLTTPEVATDGCVAKVVQTKRWGDADTPSSICLSPYVPGESVVASNDGNISYWSADGRSQLVCDHLQPRFQCLESVWTCHYGSHPRQLVVSDRTGIALYDCRRAGAAVPDLFALPNSLLHTRERLMVSSAVDGCHFYHLAATDHHLILLDERFPNYPVLTWRHLLASPPQYLAALTNVTTPETGTYDDIVLMASQRSREMMCMPFRVTDPSRPPQSTFTPWRVSQVEDFVHLSTAEGLVYNKNYHLPRLSVSLLGVCGTQVPNTNGFTALQMTAHGDIFTQTYRYVTTDTSHDKTCSAGPGSETISLSPESRLACKTWLEQHEAMHLRRTVTGEPLVDDSKVCDASDLFSAVCHKMHPHVQCCLCMTVASQQPSVQCDRADYTHCTACNVYLDQGRKLKDAVTKGEVIPSALDEPIQLGECLQGIDVTAYTDTTSQLLLNLWHNETDVGELHAKLQEEWKSRYEEQKQQQSQKSANDEQPSENPEGTNELIASAEIQSPTSQVATPVQSPTSQVATPVQSPTSQVATPVQSLTSQVATPVQSVTSQDKGITPFLDSISDGMTEVNITTPPWPETPHKRQRLLSSSSVCSNGSVDSHSFSMTPRRLLQSTPVKAEIERPNGFLNPNALPLPTMVKTPGSSSKKKNRKIVMGF